MKYLSLFSLLFCLFLINCQKKEVFQPVYQSKSEYLKESREYSKSREDSERKYLQQWVNKQRDSLQHQFEPTSSGIWMRFLTKNNKPAAKTDDRIVYSAEIKTLSNEVIYTSTEFGTKEGILGKFNEVRGIESALYKMGKGDTTELLLPSFTAYGLYGDEKKIGANVPLVVELTLLDIKSASN